MPWNERHRPKQCVLRATTLLQCAGELLWAPARTGHRQSLQAPPECLSSMEQAITQRARVHHMGGLRCKDAVAVLGGQCWNEFLQPSLVNILKQDSALTAKRVGGLGACPGLALCVDIKKTLLAYQMADTRILSKRFPSLN